MMVMISAVASKLPRSNIPRQSSAALVRSFFASSTDYTRLLADAQVRRLPSGDGSSTQYVLVAHGTEKSIVLKVPQLYLARLFVSADTMFGAKVVNRTLGGPVDVCGKLVIAAKQDGATLAKSTLHGLSDMVLQSSPTDPTVLALAEGKKMSSNANDDLGLTWEAYAREFVANQQGLEANLYMSQGGVLREILHHADESDFRDTCGGAMALFEFE